MFEIFFYPFTSIVVFFFLGMGLSHALIPKQWNKFSFWLSPWFAIIFLIVGLVLLNLLGIPITYSAWILFTCLLIITFIKVFWEKKKIEFKVRKDSIIAIFMIMVVIFNLTSLFLYEKKLTTVSLGNNDAVNYAFSSDLIKNNLIHSENINEIESVHHMFSKIYRWGPSVLESFLLTIFNLQGYQYTYVFQVVIFALIIPLVYILFRLIYQKTSILSLILVLTLTAFNVNLMYILYHNFFGQILFWGLQLFIITFLLFYLQSPKIKNAEQNLYAIIIGTALSALLMSYLEGILFVVIPWLIYLFLCLFFHPKNIKSHIVLSVKVLVIAACISFVNIIPATKRIIMLLNTSGSEPIGWAPFRSSIPFPNPLEVLGLFSIHSFEPLPLSIAIGISLLVIITIFYGLLKSKQRMFLFSFLSLYLAVYIWTGVIRHHYFEYYKAVTYTLFIVALLFVIGVFELVKNKRNMLYIVVGFLMLFEIFSAVKLNQRMNQKRISADASLISLSTLQDEFTTDEAIYSPTLLINEGTIWPRLWREYFLYPVQLTYLSKEVSDYKNRIPENHLVLLPKDSSRFSTSKIVTSQTLWENEYYYIARICNNERCLLNSSKDLSFVRIGESIYEDSLLINGWDKREGRTRWINKKEATLRLVAGDTVVNHLLIESVSLQDDQHIEVFVNQQSLGKKNLTSEWSKLVFDLKEPAQDEVLKIKLTFDKVYSPSRLGISADTRNLSANVTFIGLQ